MTYAPKRWMITAGLCGALGACNVVTGADGIDLRDSDDDDGSGGTSVTVGQGGAGSTVTSGVGGSPSGVGGSSSSVGGAGSVTTAATTTTTGATTTTTGATTTSSSVATSSSSSGGGEMCLGAGPMTTPLDSEEQAFLQIINNYRMQNGLGTLTACVSLNRAAQGHSEDMRDNNYFSHTGLNNSTPWERACDACYDQGCGPTTAMAENIAAGNSGAQATFDQWKNSPGHNANMLNGSFTVIGIGRATGGGMYGTYWTNVFGGSDEPSCY